MGFDHSKFRNAKFLRRTKAVSVPELKAFFADGDEPTWTVRALTANEIAIANFAPANRSRVEALMSALTSGRSEEIAREARLVFNVDAEEPHPDTIKRMEMLRLGSVDPACTIDDCAIINEHFPVIFRQLTDAILTLTGQGSDVEKKPGSSGQTQPSAPPADLET